MGQYQLKSAPDVQIELRQSTRARRLSLRVSSLDGRVTLTVPPGTPERVARGFAEEKARWITDAVGRVSPPIPVAVGGDLPVEGRARRILAGARRSAEIGADVILAPPGREGPAIEAALKMLARDRLEAACAHHAGKAGAAYGKITLRDTRSRWGSCSSAGNLMFSWRLILAPPAVLDYVAAHEVAHLRHMDHSARFWRLCRDLCQDTDRHRAWLRREGAALHRYRFSASD